MLLDRYLIRHVLGMSVICALALVSLQTLVTYIAELDEVGKGDFGYVALAGYVLLQVPEGLNVMLPIVGMLGTMLGLGLLASGGELVAMRAAGVSVLRFGLATGAGGIVLAACAFANSDWLAPAAHTAARELKTRAQLGVEPGIGGRTVWVREGAHVYRIERLLDERRFADLTIYTMAGSGALERVLRAGSGRWRDGHWELSDLAITEFTPQGTRASRAERMRWDGIRPEVLELYVLEARSLTVRGMQDLIAYLQANGLDAREHRLTLWRMLVAPVTVIAMMLLAVPFVLGPLRDTGAGQRLLVGVLIGLVFYIANEVSASLGMLYGWPPALAAGLPTLVATALALWRLAQFR